MPQEYTYLDKMDRAKPTIKAKHCEKCKKLLPLYCYNNRTDNICEVCIKKEQNEK